MKIECIIWRDASSHDPWCDLRDLCMSSQIVTTIGLVVKENDQTVAVSTCYSDDTDNPEACLTIIIPIVLILKREVMADDLQVECWLKMADQP